MSENGLTDAGGARLAAWFLALRERHSGGVRLRCVKLFRNRLADETCEFADGMTGNALLEQELDFEEEGLSDLIALGQSFPELIGDQIQKTLMMLSAKRSSVENTCTGPAKSFGAQLSMSKLGMKGDLVWQVDDCVEVCLKGDSLVRAAGRR